MRSSGFQLLIGLLCPLIIADGGSAAHVLGIFTFPGQSNFHFNKAILQSLHEAGHRITFLTTFASAVKSTPNFTVVDVSGGIPNLVGGFSPEFAMSFTVVERSRFLFTHEEKFCSHVVQSPVIQVRALHPSQNFVYRILRPLPSCRMHWRRRLNSTSCSPSSCSDRSAK